MIHAEIEPGRSDCPRSWKPGVIASSPVPCGAGLGARSAGRWIAFGYHGIWERLPDGPSRSPFSRPESQP